jgi:hypothetical protein
MSVKIVFDTWKHLNSATELQLNKSHEGQQIQWKERQIQELSSKGHSQR